ncbi:hypothetical protein DSO57_1025924 [Entomophthora muscae]|uniref:Uncharacterized protein n=1 Tax=Entomophthora muscae TaxID=34485 RepID=A0ACC2RT97_9FUNG|nr:hypothetical protein DSO57_1025924 [Entomophthora muscae]
MLGFSAAILARDVTRVPLILPVVEDVPVEAGTALGVDTTPPFAINFLPPPVASRIMLV